MDPVATLSTDGEREYRAGEGAASLSGLKALRSWEGLRFLVAVEGRLDIEGRLRGMFSWGRCGGEAILASFISRARYYGSRDWGVVGLPGKGGGGRGFEVR